MTMTLEDAQKMLKSVMDGVEAGRQEPKHSKEFPLHAQWESFPFASDEHYAVARALGIRGPSGESIVKPVGRTRTFFKELLDAGLIDTNGNASQALKDEVESKQAKKQQHTLQLLAAWRAAAPPSAGDTVEPGRE